MRKQRADNATQLTRQVALVTGASSGIGAATAHELTRRGARVVLTARRADELERQRHSIVSAGGQAVAVACDLADRAATAQLAQDAAAVWDRVDILVNNAGVGFGQPLTHITPDDITRIVEVNLLGPMLLTRALLPGMLERRHGAIISIASVAGHVATEPLYSATKFGLRGFSLSLHRQLADSGVSVSLVSPGFIRTAMTAETRGRLPGPQVVATVVADLVTRPRRETRVPRRYIGAVWLERLLPAVVDHALRGRV